MFRRINNARVCWINKTIQIGKSWQQGSDGKLFIGVLRSSEWNRAGGTRKMIELFNIILFNIQFSLVVDIAVHFAKNLSNEEGRNGFETGSLLDRNSWFHRMFLVHPWDDSLNPPQDVIEMLGLSHRCFRMGRTTSNVNCLKRLLCGFTCNQQERSSWCGKSNQLPQHLHRCVVKTIPALGFVVEFTTPSCDLDFRPKLATVCAGKTFKLRPARHVDEWIETDRKSKEFKSNCKGKAHQLNCWYLQSNMAMAWQWNPRFMAWDFQWPCYREMDLRHQRLQKLGCNAAWIWRSGHSHLYHIDGYTIPILYLSL